MEVQETSDMEKHRKVKAKIGETDRENEMMNRERKRKRQREVDGER